MFFYINVTNILYNHVAPGFVKSNDTLPPTKDTDGVMALVDPISKVEKSVYCTLEPFHTDITSPDLALDPDDIVYLQNKEVNDPVTLVSILTPAPLAELILLFASKVPPILKLLAYDAVAA